MEMHQLRYSIPFEIGDIIKAEGYINEYEVIDILTIYSAKTKKVEVIFKLKDLSFNLEAMWRYEDYKWLLVTLNSDRKEVKNEQKSSED